MQQTIIINADVVAQGPTVMPTTSGIQRIEFTISDTEMKAIGVTPVIVPFVAAIPGRVWSLVAGWVNGVINAAGAVPVNGTLRYTGSATALSNAFVLNGAGAGVLRSEVVSNGFGGAVGVDQANRTIEFIGNASADAAFATTDGLKVTLLLVSVPQ